MVPMEALVVLAWNDPVWHWYFT